MTPVNSYDKDHMCHGKLGLFLTGGLHRVMDPVETPSIQWISFEAPQIPWIQDVCGAPEDPSDCHSHHL